MDLPYKIPNFAGNAGRADMQPQRGGASTYMDVDEAAEDKEGDDKSTSGGVDGKTDEKKVDDGDDNVTEQTHHIIVPSYRYTHTHSSMNASFGNQSLLFLQLVVRLQRCPLDREESHAGVLQRQEPV